MTNSQLDRRLDVLSRTECLTLLGTVRTGRIAYCGSQGAPRIEVVNFILDGGDVVIRMAIGNKSAAVGRGASFALEADRLNEADGTGWDVTAIGPVSWVTDPAEMERLGRLLHSSAPGDRPHFARIATQHVFGRRVLAWHRMRSE
jgi:nitroimidazol reductase NimA-like FMN-containing flavoprotein (pyridoxamine 5'-phosphate oxidase superfamily)